MRKGLSDVALGCAREWLGRSGFKKRNPQIYTCEIKDDVLGFVGLNKANFRGEGVVWINPVVGVRHQRVERLVAELCGVKFHSYIPPTVSSSLGYLMPENAFRTWSFSDGGDMQAEAAAMAAAVSEFGLPFMRTYSDLATLGDALRYTRLGIKEQIEYRIPAIWYLLKRESAAEAYLRARLSELSGRNDPAADLYRRYAEAFLGLLG